MRDLHVVALSEDGRHVVLATRPGTATGDFRVALDERLVAAVKGELPAPGRNAPPSISPRDIQARLRDGETPEQIAASAGVPLSRVERYAGPVLAELDRMITGARGAVVSRPRLGPSARPLGDAVEAHLAEVAHLAEGSVRWSARRTDHGRWVVEVAWTARGRRRTAGWHYDPTTREITAADGPSAVLGHVEADAAAAPAGARSARPAGAPAPAARGAAPRGAGRATGTTRGSAPPAPRRAVASTRPVPEAAPAQPARPATTTTTGLSPRRSAAPPAQGALRRRAATSPPAAPPAATPAAATTTPRRSTSTARSATAAAPAPAAAPSSAATKRPAAPRRRAATTPPAPTTAATATPAARGRADFGSDQPESALARRAAPRRTTPVRSAVPSLDELTPGAGASGRAPRRSERPAEPPAAGTAPGTAQAPPTPPPTPPPGPPLLRVVPSAAAEPVPEAVDDAPPARRAAGQRAAGQRAAGQRDWADVLMGGGPAPSTAEPRQDP